MAKNKFERAYDFVRQWEGGYVNHQSDPGGATHFGISLRFLKEHGVDIDGDGDVDADDIRALTPAKARELYKNYFWDKLNCDKLPFSMALVLFDGAVNQGGRRGATQLQQAMVDEGLPYDLHIAADGAMGPRSLEMAEALDALHLSERVSLRTISKRMFFYRDLVKRKQALQVFLKGWERRCNALAEELAYLQNEEVQYGR